MSSFLAEKSLFPKNSIPYLISEKFVQDIDTDEDWEIAQLKYKLFVQKVF